VIVFYKTSHHAVIAIIASTYHTALMPSMELQSLESLLNDKDLRTEFIYFVNKRRTQELLLFWMEVEMYKRIVDSDQCFKYLFHLV
jgi:Regulator of G protein signaling domain